MGKSYLADWMEVWRNAFVVTGGKFADIAYAFQFQEYVVFDFARDQQDRFPYKLLEDFKVLQTLTPPRMQGGATGSGAGALTEDRAS